MDNGRVDYSGESVKSTIRRLYGDHPEAPVKLPHATVPPITAHLIQGHAHVLDAVFNALREQLQNEQQSAAGATTTATAAVAGHWLLSVPTSLRHSEVDVVNYLGMLVAIDFCHWAEVHRPSASSSSPTAAAATTVEEGCIEAAPGEEVTGFAGFYTVVEATPPTATTAAAEVDEGTEEILTEPKAATSSSPSTSAVTLLRGSAAMMWLLRRAVEVHGTPWYDVAYLAQFHGDVDAALRALQLCFVGCEADGVTPLWMPCTRTRVQLLLSLADAFQRQETSFHQLLCDSEGYMFQPPADTAASCAGVCGFVPSLVRFHPRYQDITHEGGAVEHGAPLVPILKLSQLTALALEQAVPAFWCARCTDPEQPPPPPPLPSPSPRAVPSFGSGWMALRAAAIAEALASSPSAARQPGSTVAGLFTDGTELSICCDYQIPKTLRAAGLITYDAHLAYLVDHHVLLRPGCAEEASIRIATLVAADRLLDFVNGPEGVSLLRAQHAKADGGACLAPSLVNHLDYALWYVGRYMVPSEARHHLCRTIMY